jgi:protein Hikeshi
MIPHRAPPPTKLLAQRIIKNAFNFLASFAGGSGGQEVVPLKSFQDWWTKFERRVENDPGFLERDGD